MATPLDVITLDDAKDYLKVDFPDEDALITQFIKSCVAMVENATQQRLYRREEVVFMSGWKAIFYPYPLITIDEVKNQEGVVQDSGNYSVYDGVVKLPSCGQWQVKATVGYDSGLVPQPLIDAALLCLHYKYNNRGLADKAIVEAQDVIDHIAPYKEFTWF